jgi:LysM repeat protein
MRNTRKVFFGISVALISLALLFGVYSISMAEGNIYLSPATPSPSHTATWQLSPTSPSQEDTSSLPSIWTPTWSPTPTATPTPTPSPSPTYCYPPVGWSSYLVQPGDTLYGLAQQYRATSSDLLQANCMGMDNLPPGQMIYLPPAQTIYLPPTPFQYQAPCGGPPSSWVIYIIQPGDTLYHLSQIYNVSYTEIQRANCLSTYILRVGQQLYVPPWGSGIPTTSYLGEPPYTTLSDTPYLITVTETSITETATPTFVDTATAVPTATNTLPPP